MRTRLTLLVPRVGFGALAVACFAVPVVFSRQTAEAFMVPKVAVLGLCLIVAIVGLATWTIAARRSPFPSLTIRWPLALLVGWTALATALSPAPWLSLVGHYGRYDGFVGVISGAAFALCIVGYTWRNPGRLRVLAIAVVASGGFGLAYVTIQQLGWDWITWLSEELKPIERPYGLLGNSNFSGAHLAICVPLVLALAAVSTRRLERWGLWALAGGLAVGTWWTGTRGGLLALVGGIAVGAALVPDLVPRVVRYGTIALTAVGLALVLAASTGVAGDGRTEAAGPRVLQSATLADRQEIWVAGLTMARDHPLVGVGPDAFSLAFPDARPTPDPSELALNADEAHNVFIDRLATAGIPALIAYLWLVAGCALAAWRGRRRVVGEQRWLLAGFSGAFGAYLLQGSFSIDTVPLALMGWVCIGAIASIAEPAALDRRDDGVPAVTLRPVGYAPMLGLGLGAVVLASLVLKPLIADVRFRDGQEALSDGRPAAIVAADFQAATNWMPIEPRYRVKVGDQLAAIATRETTDPDLQIRLLEEALLAYDEALRLAPGDIYIRRTQARTLGLLADIDAPDQDDRLDASIEIYQSLVEQSPTDVDLRLQTALMLETRARRVESQAANDAAAEEFEELRRLAPGSTAALSGLARLAVQEGRLEEARDLLQEAQHLDPRDPAVRMALDQVDDALAEASD